MRGMRGMRGVWRVRREGHLKKRRSTLAELRQRIRRRSTEGVVSVQVWIVSTVKTAMVMVRATATALMKPIMAMEAIAVFSRRGVGRLVSVRGVRIC